MSNLQIYLIVVGTVAILLAVAYVIDEYRLKHTVTKPKEPTYRIWLGRCEYPNDAFMLGYKAQERCWYGWRTLGVVEWHLEYAEAHLENRIRQRAAIKATPVVFEYNSEGKPLKKSF